MGYWSLDIPGLTENEAGRLLALSTDHGMGQFGMVVDPAKFLTLNLDRATVEAIYAALAKAAETKPESTDGQAERAILSGIAEVLEDWLKRPG